MQESQPIVFAANLEHVDIAASTGQVFCCANDICGCRPCNVETLQNLHLHLIINPLKTKFMVKVLPWKLMLGEANSENQNGTG